MPVDRASDLIETLLEAVEPCRERLYRVGNEVESGGLWQPSAVCSRSRRPDVQSTGGRTAAVGPARVGSIIPSDAVFRALAASSSPSAALAPPPDVLRAGRLQGRIPCRDSTATVPPRSTMSPIVAARAGSKAFPYVADAGTAALRWRLYPRGTSKSDLARPTPSAAMRTGVIRVTRRRSAARPAPLRSQTADARSPASIRKGSCRTPIGRRSHARRD